MREIDFAPEALGALDSAISRDALLGDRLDEALDWIEQTPVDVRAKRRAFASQTFAIEVRVADEEWLILWRENRADPSAPRVLYLGPSLL